MRLRDYQEDCLRAIRAEFGAIQIRHLRVKEGN